MPTLRSGDRTQSLAADIPLVLAGVSIGVLGLLNLRSAVSVVNLEFFETQRYWFAGGALAALVLWLADYRALLRYSYVLYGGALLFLILVLAIGQASKGAQRWIFLGPFSFQPSEPMKIALILAIARIFHSDVKPEPRTLREFALPAALTVLPTVLVVEQPDLGTSLLYPLIFFSMVMVLRVRLRTILLSIAGVLALIPVAWSYLHGYQKERVVTFFSVLWGAEETLDVKDAAWQTIQSKIAVGSGGLLGKGYLQGTQNQLGFIPYQHTDFPFAVWAEEHGFVGSALLMGLYFFVILWAIRIAARARDRFGALVATGVAAMFFWHVVINLGMVLGLLPVVGVTLPFFSYGGTSILTNLCGIGLLLSVSARRLGSAWEA